MKAFRKFESTTEARNALPQHLKEFSELGSKAKPVFIGRHRKPEAALVPISIFEQVLEKELLKDEVKAVVQRMARSMELEDQALTEQDLQEIHAEILTEESQS